MAELTSAIKNQEVGGSFTGHGLFSGRPLIIAGPCSVENEEMILASARAVKAAGANALRGGAFKPRSNPRSFQGLGAEGLRLLSLAKAESGLPVVTEVMDASEIELVAGVADVLQIGSRNMQNFALLKQVGRAGKPVMLKRGLSATVAEWLGAAEYITASGNDQVILCERGIRTFETATRNTLDLSGGIAAKNLSGFPLIVDPSHAAGRRDLIPALAKAALAGGADGLMIEVHPNPVIALSDAEQQLDFAAFHALMASLGLLPIPSLDGMEACRSEIDRIDDELLALLARRMETARRIGDLKKEKGLLPFQPDRERSLLSRLTEKADPALRPHDVQLIWDAILTCSRRAQVISAAQG